MARNKSTTTTVVVSMGVLLTIGAMLVAAPSAYAEKTCIGACKNHHNEVDNSVDNSGQDNSVDSHNTVDSHDTVDSHNIVEAPCTAPGGVGGQGGGQGGTGGVGGAGGCNRT